MILYHITVQFFYAILLTERNKKVIIYMKAVFTRFFSVESIKFFHFPTRKTLPNLIIIICIILSKRP